MWSGREPRVGLLETSLDSIAKEVFDGAHLTREDNRTDYGELRYITVGWLDARLVVLVWTPRRRARRVISMRKANGREIRKFASQVA